MRKDLIGPQKALEELGRTQLEKNEGDDSYWDTIEAFFDFLYNEFSWAGFGQIGIFTSSYVCIWHARAGQINLSALESSRVSEGLIMVLPIGP